MKKALPDYCGVVDIPNNREVMKHIEGIRPSKFITFADGGNKLFFVDDNKVVWEVKRHELIKSKIDYDNLKVVIAKKEGGFL